MSRWTLPTALRLHVASVLGHFEFLLPVGLSPGSEGFGFSRGDSELVLLLFHFLFPNAQARPNPSTPRTELGRLPLAGGVPTALPGGLQLPSDSDKFVLGDITDYFFFKLSAPIL